MKKRVITDKHKEAISKSLQGKAPWSLGKELPETVKESISATMKDRCICPGKTAREANIVSISKRWLVTFPDGHQEMVTNLREFCREHTLTPQNMIKVMQGKIGQHKGFRCDKL